MRHADYMLTWQLGAEWDALPVLATIAGMQQDSGLAHNPTLVTAEADGVEAVVEALVLSSLNGAWLPALATIKGLQQGLASTQQEA